MVILKRALEGNGILVFSFLVFKMYLILFSIPFHAFSFGLLSDVTAS